MAANTALTALIKKPGRLKKKMQKNKLIFCLGLLSFFTKAQTNFFWYPFHPNTQYNYKIDSSASPISAVIKIDSIGGNSFPNYYLNKIVTNCDTCHNSLLVNDPNDSTYILNNQAQFAGLFSSRISARAFRFKSSRPFFIFPFDTTGYSWVFDSLLNIHASIVSKNAQTVLGISDSVCIIKLSTNDTIILSKNMGIVQFPFKTNTAHHYKLNGIEGTTSYGIKLKRFHDFFDFHAGDVLQYTFSDEDYNSLPPLLKYGRERWDFLAVNVYTDSVVCRIRKTYFDSLKLGGGPPTITAYTTIETISFMDSLKHPANFYPLEEVRVDPYFLYSNGLKYIHKIVLGLDNHSRSTKSFGENCPNIYLSPGATGAAVETIFNNVFLNENSVKLVGRQLTEGLGFSSELYNDYSRIYQKCLSGYIKGSDTSGTVYETNLTSIQTNSFQKNTFSIYPVPADNAVTIAGSFKDKSELLILNSLGIEVGSYNLNTQNTFYHLNTSGLMSGVYFIVISNQNSTETKKLFIQH
jgi:hypothetical protein